MRSPRPRCTRHRQPGALCRVCVARMVRPTAIKPAGARSPAGPSAGAGAASSGSAGPPPPAASAASASCAGPGAGSARSMAASGSCGSAHAKTSDRFWRPGTRTCAAAAAWAGRRRNPETLTKPGSGSLARKPAQPQEPGRGALRTLKPTWHEAARQDVTRAGRALCAWPAARTFQKRSRWSSSNPVRPRQTQKTPCSQDLLSTGVA
jgi:hypothetical protein